MRERWFAVVRARRGQRRGRVVGILAGMDDALDEQEIAEIVAGVREGRYTIGGGPSDGGWRVRVENGRVIRNSWTQNPEDGGMEYATKELSDEDVAAALRTYGRKVVRKQ